jgi:hypothetical protein
MVNSTGVSARLAVTVGVVVLALLNRSAPLTDDWGTENRPFVFLVLAAIVLLVQLLSGRRAV